MKCDWGWCQEQATHNVYVPAHNEQTDKEDEILLCMCAGHTAIRAAQGDKVERIDKGKATQ